MANEFLDAEFLPLDIEEIAKTKYDKNKFQTGLCVGSFYAGIAAALFNVGLDNENVTDFLESYLEKEAKCDTTNSVTEIANKLAEYVRV